MTVGKRNFYNEESKVAFLNTIESDSTRVFTRSTFSRLKDAEEAMSKDLYEMSLKEIEVAMQVYAGTKSSTKVLKLSLLERYIDWSIGQGLRYNLLNPISNIDKKKVWVETFI